MKKKILLINPNTSEATTVMMVEIANRYLQQCAPLLQAVGHTARYGPTMLLNEVDLVTAAQAVNEKDVVEASHDADAIIIAAFGDPGMEQLRQRLTVPIVGIGESSILEASADNRKFGIATTTPELENSIAAQVQACGVSQLYAGLRLTESLPLHLASSPGQQADELERAVQDSVMQDNAQAVIIGGGPLGNSAQTLQERLHLPVINPIIAACKRLITLVK